MAFAELAVDAFLERLASADPTPGGGSAAALAGAQGAALTAMVARLTVGKKRYADVQEEVEAILKEADELRRAFLADADADAAAFDAVSAAMKLPKGTEAEKAARKAALDRALREAARVPLEVAQRGIRLLELAERIGRIGNRNAVSDAGVAALLGRTAVLGALLNVRINLAFLPEDEETRAWAAQAEALEARARELEARVW